MKDPAPTGPSRNQIFASLAALGVMFAVASCALSSDTASETEGEEALHRRGAEQPQQIGETVASPIRTAEDLPRSLVRPGTMSTRDLTRANHASSLVEPGHSASRAGGMVWGGLDAARVGHPSMVLETGDLYDELRAQITGAGDLIVAGASTIDAAYLNSIDVLFISYPGVTGALSAAEQAALQPWVSAGGRLIVISEQTNVSEVETYTAMFGVTGWTSGGPLSGSRPALSAHPLVAGVNAIDFMTASATFTAPADGVLLADYPGGDPLIAVQDQDTGLSLAGCVLVFGDFNALADGSINNADNLQFAVNMIDWVNTCGAAQVTINELRIDQPGVDIDEYLEIAGPAGTDLSGLTLLVIGDGGAAMGHIDNATDLTGQTIPASGYFVMAESTFTLGVADLTTSLNFENSDNVTFLLVAGFTGTADSDLDTDDDCVLDAPQWAYLVDELALVETPGSGDCIYSAVTIGPDTTYTPAHVYRCPDGDGSFLIADHELNASDTPGAANAPCAANGTACAQDTDCTSGHCVDGVCCDSSCGGSDPNDCQACTAVLTGDSDGTCAPVLVDEVCRAAAGDCDIEETCNGADLTCPADVLANPGDACGDSTDDDCANPDTCDDAGFCQDNDEAPGTSCGDSTDDECANPDTCDDAGVCQGNDEVAGTNCGDAGTECTIQDTCDGVGACTDQGFQPAVTACGDSTDDECTNPDGCDGAGICLSNHEASGFSCGDAGTDCVNQDTCDGSGVCSDNGFQSEGTACGDSTDDECTAPDTCDAVGGCQDHHEAAGTACDDQGVDCNVDDECDGSGVCTDNGVEAAGTACGDSSDHDCTDPDTCDDAGSCLPNDVASGTVCRAAAGECDTEEVCDGAGSECPSDLFAAAGTVCRVATGECDAEEVCDGAGGECPADGLAADGTSCDDGDSCTGGDACGAGSCQAGSEDLCAAPPPSGEESTHAEGGCGCRVVAPRQGQGHHGWLWLALGVPILRRRWRRAAV